jgi:hypothetical protein
MSGKDHHPNDDSAIDEGKRQPRQIVRPESNEQRVLVGNAGPVLDPVNEMGETKEHKYQTDDRADKLYAKRMDPPLLSPCLGESRFHEGYVSEL